MLPYIIDGGQKHSEAAMLNFIKDNQHTYASLLSQHGAILLRNFDIDTPERFRKVLDTMQVSVSDNYPLGLSPRKKISSGIFNSTEIAGMFSLNPHNEMAYLKTRPSLIAFYCSVAPAIYGETPIYDTAYAFSQLSEKAQSCLVKGKFKYTHIYKKELPVLSLKFERTWPDIFSTTDQSVVSQYLEECGYEYHWSKSGTLTYHTVVPPVIRHSETGVNCLNLQLPHWYAIYRGFQILKQRQSRWVRLPIMLIAHLRYVLGQMATYFSFADGKPIGLALVREIYNALQASQVIFPWQQNDLLILDNRSVAHGRMNVIQPRRILVALGNMYSTDEDNNE